MKLTPMFLVLLPSVAAFADPAPPPPPSPGQPPMHLQLGIKNGADTRTYQLVVDSQSCGSLVSKTADHEDKIRVCGSPTPQGIRLDVEWKMSSQQLDYSTEWKSVVQRGATIEVGQAGGIRFSLQMT